MDGMDAVLDSPEVVDEFQEQPVEEAVVDPAAPADPAAAAPTDNVDDPYSSKASKEYANWLKGIRDSDPNNARYARLAKDDHSKLYQLHQLDPKGLDGVRERYALMDSLMHGEKTGVDAIGAMQDELTRMQQVDERLMTGDVTALDDMGEEFTKQALPAMVGPILDRVRDSNPEVYAKTILPHLVEALKPSELVANFNSLVDVLNEQPPTWLTPDQKSHWITDRLQRVTQNAGKMAQWFNTQQQKATEIGSTPAKPGQKPSDPILDREKQLDTRETEHHWNTSIKPSLDKYASDKFQQEFGPYQKRLKLDAIAMSALKREYAGRVSKAAVANKQYTDQIGRYRAQKTPNAATVLNFAKVEFDKHSKSVMDGLIKERYQPFLTGGQKQATPPAATPAQQTANGVKLVPVKPPMEQIDHKRTPIDWLHQRKYRMRDGSVVQVARQ